MELNEIKYIVDNISSLCGIPTRIYQDKKKIYYSSYLKFPKDPIILDEEILFAHKEHVTYYVNDFFFNYGILNYNNLQIFIGPFRFRTPTNQDLYKLVFNLNLNKQEAEEFITSMKMIISMPISSVIQTLCMFNFILNGEKLSIKDIFVDEKKASLDYVERSNNSIDSDTLQNNDNSAYILEKEIERIVENGCIEQLNEFIKKAPSTRPGILSNDTIRQHKNIFVVTTTLVSRAAIRGGLSPIEALKLSDLYIQKMELLTSISEIQTLQVKMIIEYTNSVAKIKGNSNSSELLINLNKYIISHLSDAIKINEVCNALYISKSSLFEHIKKETGSTVSDYILQMKINESKNLLKYTDKNLATISLYLGFSSQSHFNHTFKKFVGSTPLEYKKSSIK